MAKAQDELLDERVCGMISAVFLAQLSKHWRRVLRRSYREVFLAGVIGVIVWLATVS
jgi:hypothetical protein